MKKVLYSFFSSLWVSIAVSIVVEHGGSGSELAAIAADILSYYFSSQGTREEIPRENTLVR